MASKNELDKNMQEAIDNYSSRIQTLKDFVTAVRTRPGMYIGGLPTALITMIREIFQNSVDQLLDQMSPCNWISLVYDQRILQTTVIDNGLGFPFDDIIRILTAQHTSKNYEKKKGDYSSGLNGVGAKVVNALSELFVVESYHYSGKAVRQEFCKGYPNGDLKDIPNKEKKQGSLISFIPDKEILGNDVDLDWEAVYRLVKIIMSLTPIGSAMEFKAIDKNGCVHEETIINKDGIVTDLIMKCKSPITKPIVIGDDDGVHKIDIAFCFSFSENDAFNDMNITSFCNFCPTKLGTHINGSIDGITRWFTLYMNNIYLSNQKSKDKLKVIANDIKIGLNIMISAAHIDPFFTGQAKEELSNPDMEPFCKVTIMKGLDAWSKSNPQDLSKLCKFFKDMAEIRQKAEQSKTKVAQKYTSNVLTGLPAKYAKPLLKIGTEIFIVEGDSAGGMAKDGRLRDFQGVFPIRGKFPNAFRTSYADMMANAEVQALIRIILKGKPYTRNFDPYKDVDIEKIIIMADADIDGKHIAALLLRFFLLYMPQLITAGKLYCAVPPLYSISKGKENVYFTEQIDIVRYVQKYFSENNVIETMNNGKMSNKDLTVFLLTNKKYVYELEKVSDNYSLKPELLEMVLYNRYNNQSIPALKKTIKNNYRFMNVVNRNGIDIVEGTIDRSYKLFMNQRFFDECKNIFEIISQNKEIEFKMNGEYATIYTIMKAYANCNPSSLQRYKGLGEMDVDEIVDSTMSPYGSRTLIRYTIEDVKETIAAIREYESDMSKLFKFIGNIDREDLLD